MQPHYVLKLAAAVKDPYSQGALTLPPTSRRCRQRLCSICTGFCSALGDWGSGLYRPFMLVVLACILGLVPTSSAISGTMVRARVHAAVAPHTDRTNCTHRKATAAHTA